MTHQDNIIDVIANSMAGMHWLGLAIICAVLFIVVVCCVLAAEVFGVKKHLDGVEQAIRAQTDAMLFELQRMNGIVIRMPNTGIRQHPHHQQKRRHG